MVYCNTAKRKRTFKNQGMKKTAMQLLIEFMHGAYSKHDIYKKATELLETERKQIEMGYYRGKSDYRASRPLESEQYYKDTYQ